MKPFSAAYYVKNNKMRSMIIILMMIMTTFLLLAGNYIESLDWYWNGARKANEDIVMVEAYDLDSLEDYSDVIKEIKEDKELECFERTGYGISGLGWTCTLGFKMGSSSYLFNSKEDLARAFELMGIECDLTDVKNGSIIMGDTHLRNINHKKGDVIEASELTKIEIEDFTIDAVIENTDSFVLYCVYDGGEKLYRANIMSSSLNAEEIRNRISEIAGERKIRIYDNNMKLINEQFDPFKALTLLGSVLLSIIMAVTTNSVITGQYIKRTYEFGVYMALGIQKGRIKRKCCAEILLMDAVAVVIGIALIFISSFILNELYYMPKGQYLPYYSKLGIECFLIANVLVVVPMMLLKGRQMAKADITEF